MDIIDSIKEICTINKRVCPKPQKWDQLWKALKNKSRTQNSWTPSPPLILAAWYHTSDFLKQERLMAHLKWAEKENQLEEIYDFLLSLEEFDWHHEQE